MITSEARIAANRANALKSTGPRTAEGKERSRCNAVKHGLTGGGVALPAADAPEVERRAAAFEDQFRPASEAGLALVRRAAVLSVRVERCAAYESAAISTRVRAAAADFDEARAAEVDRLFEAIGEAPAASLRRLLRMPEGVDRLLDRWAALRSDLAHGDGSRWTAEHTALAVHLTGRAIGAIGFGRVEALGRAVGGDDSLLAPAEGAGLDPAGRRDRARRELLAAIDATAAGLEAHRETIDREAIDLDRAGAADRALFDPSAEATLARKYEAAAERGMLRALKELKAVEAVAADAARPPSPSRPLASFSPATATRPVAPAQTSAPAPMPVPAGSRPVSSAGSSFIPMAIGRPAAAPARG